MSRSTIRDAAMFMTNWNESLFRRQDSPEDIVVQKDVEEQVGIALMYLKPEDRAIVCLKHFQGFSYQEIGYILDISDKTVKSRLFTARRRLKDVLQRIGIN